MRRWPLLLGAALWACGGSSAPAQSADDLSSESEESEAPALDEAAEPSSESASPDKAKKAKASGQASADDVREVLQAVIEDEALNPYLHMEQPKRFPLKIAARNVPSGIELTKATEPVVIVPEAKEGEPVLVFTEVEVGPEEASVRYRYDIEKVRGSVTLFKRFGRWEIKSSRVTER